MKQQVIALGVMVLAASGCSKQDTSGTFRNIRPSITLASAALPAKGIFSIDQVVVKNRGGNDYELAAAANSGYGFNELSAVVYCRAAKLSAEKGFTTWYPQVSAQSVTANGNRVYNSIVTLVKGTLPQAASKTQAASDWCNQLPK